MSKPRLTFFCELQAAPLQVLFSLPDMVALADLNASISMGILDLSPSRAEVVQRLNQAGIPLVAWLLLPREEGYWLNLDNAQPAADRYRAFVEWTQAYGLIWDGVALDIEPDIQDMDAVAANKWSTVPLLVRRILRNWRISGARRAYHSLVEQIRSDGYRVDSYQLPFIMDERLARSTLLQRAAGLVDLPSDREVLLLYTSYMRPHGAGVLWSYGKHAQSIAVGSTGGGVDHSLRDPRPLAWEEFERDLRLAWVFTDDIHIFSLEGCVKEGYLTQLKSFDWDIPLFEPEEMAARVNGLRRTLQSALWLGSRPHIITGFNILLLYLFIKLRKQLNARREPSERAV